MPCLYPLEKAGNRHLLNSDCFGDPTRDYTVFSDTIYHSHQTFLAYGLQHHSDISTSPQLMEFILTMPLWGREILAHFTDRELRHRLNLVTCHWPDRKSVAGSETEPKSPKLQPTVLSTKPLVLPLQRTYQSLDTYNLILLLYMQLTSSHSWTLASFSIYTATGISHTAKSNSSSQPQFQTGLVLCKHSHFTIERELTGMMKRHIGFNVQHGQC